MRKVILTNMENMKYEAIKNYVDHPPKYGLKTKSKKRIAKKLQVGLSKLKDGLQDMKVVEKNILFMVIEEELLQEKYQKI